MCAVAAVGPTLLSFSHNTQDPHTHNITPPPSFFILLHSSNYLASSKFSQEGPDEMTLLLPSYLDFNAKASHLFSISLIIRSHLLANICVISILG
uniref:Uncharacterized protein n=1 Tax=Cannabis sativa TaxID=3483 RepID=A0A803QT62_CANSA